jgi:hypothetical protein
MLLFFVTAWGTGQADRSAFLGVASAHLEKVAGQRLLGCVQPRRSPAPVALAISFTTGVPQFPRLHLLSRIRVLKNSGTVNHWHRTSVS